MARLAPWAAATLVLLVALVGTVASEEVRWDGYDFAVAAALLYGACGANAVARRVIRTPLRRALAGLAILGLLLLVWAELAVGIVGA